MKIKFRNSVAMSALLVVGLIGSAYVSLRADSKVSILDNTSWKVSVEPDDMAKKKGEKEFNDTLTFADGFVSMSEGQKMGFDSSVYQVNKNGEKAWTFTTEQQNDSQGKQLWTGTIDGDDIQGKLIVTKNDGTVLTFHFKGDKLD